MMQIIRRLFAVTLCLLVLLPILPHAQAKVVEARDITADALVQTSGFDSPAKLTDKKINTYFTSSGNAGLTFLHKDGIAGLYLLFDVEYGEYTVTDTATGKTFIAGKNSFVHEYIDLEAAFGYLPTSVDVQFSNGAVRLSEVYAFTKGHLPDFVQTWDAPLEGGADLVLFSTHGDDDQLFFAGLLPYYAVQRGYRVQVVYMTNHRNFTNLRVHEMLNGLWAVGITAYPVFGEFDDFRIDDMEKTYKEYQRRGTSRAELLEFVVEQLRRFKPLVAVGHDLNGEYQHGMHMVYADLLCEAVTISADVARFPLSSFRYGVWDTPKTYIHLYNKNKILLDLDKPMEEYGGLSPFQVSQKLGFPSHRSQQYAWLVEWLYGKNKEITKATQIGLFNPAQYGLYRSTVGEDTQKNDMFENIVTYAEQERIEEEKRQEEERKKQEEEQRRKEEEERKKREEAARLEAERLAQEQARAEAAAKRAQHKQFIRICIIVCLCLALILFFVIGVLLGIKHKSKK